MSALDIVARGLAKRALDSGMSFSSVAAMLSGTQSARGAGSIWRAAGYSYSEAASGASDHDVTTAGGVKLYVLAQNGRYPLEAFGFAESKTAAQNKAIMRAALDKGPCSCGEGDFPLSQFFWASYDDFQGSGYGTHFVSASGIVMKYGCFAGDSCTVGDPDAMPKYTINSVTSGNNSFTCSTAAEAANFTAGGTVVLWSSTGYTDGSGEFKPVFQQITGVVSVDAGTGIVVTEQPIYRDTPAAATMVATPGEDVTGREQNGDTGITRNVKSGNFSVTETAGGDSWARFGGTYQSEIGPVWVRKSSRAAVMNGLAHCTFHIPFAEIDKHLLDCAMFCHNTTYRIDQWSERVGGANGGFALVSLSEGARDNILNVGPGQARNTTQRTAAVLIGQGVHGNTINVADITIPNALSAITADRPSSSVMDYHTNRVFIEGAIRVGACNHAISHAATTVGEIMPLEVRGGRIVVPAAAVSQINTTASQLMVDCEIDAGTRPIIVNAASKDIDLSRARFVNKPSALPSLPQVRLPSTFGAGRQIDGIGDSTISGSAIAATSFTARYSKTVKAGSFLPNDAIAFRFGGRCTGANNTKTVAIRVTTNSATVTASVALPASFVDDFAGEAYLVFLPTAGNERLNIAVMGNGIYPSVDNQNVAHDVATYDMLIEVGGYVANVADALYLEGVFALPPIRRRA